MNNVYDLGADVPYTDEDLEVLLGCSKEEPERRSCHDCKWFNADFPQVCSGPLSCLKWRACGKCCPLTGQCVPLEFESCQWFTLDPECGAIC